MSNETVRELCAEAKSMNWVGYWNERGKTVEDFIDRIIAAHEREEAEMCRKLRRLQKQVDNFCALSKNVVAEKEAEIARLKAALKPVMNINVDSAINHCVDCTELFCSIIKDAQSIYKEGEAK